MTHDVLDGVAKYDLDIRPEIIGSGGSSIVQVAYLDVTKYAVKKFKESSKEEDITNEIKIMKIASHPNIIRFFGVTKLQGKPNYSLVLEYADGGTIKKYLRNNTTIIECWKSQFKFSTEIASAVSWLHRKKVIHGDINPNNILIHQRSIKLADFGCSRLQGDKVSIKPRGTIPYVDPKVFYEKCDLTEKSDIYSLALVFWELTSCSSPFDYEMKENHSIMLEILNGKRENPMPNTNGKFVALYNKCWQYEPGERPDIHEVISVLNSINPIKSKNNEMLTNFGSKESEESESTEDEDLSNCEKYDITSEKYDHCK